MRLMAVFPGQVFGSFTFEASVTIVHSLVEVLNACKGLEILFYML